MWDFIHKIVVEISLAAFWIYHVWEKFWKAEEFFERRIHLRRKIDMSNPIADIQLALQILAEVRTALPILGNAIVDLKQAYADKSDPTKATQDLANALAVIEPLINQVLALVPSAASSVPPVSAK